jgi:putative sigma-54 modulation protein
MKLSEALKDYAREKVEKVNRHLDSIVRGEVEFITEGNPSISNNQRVEITLWTKGPLIRAVASSSDSFASVDLAVDKLERQVDKYKGKVYSSRNKHSSKLSRLGMKSQAKRRQPLVSKKKQFVVKPMTLNEALLQMELLGHDFFVFLNAETETLHIVYRRKDETLGLIEALLG